MTGNSYLNYRSELLPRLLSPCTVVLTLQILYSVVCMCVCNANVGVKDRVAVPVTRI